MRKSIESSLKAGLFCSGHAFVASALIGHEGEPQNAFKNALENFDKISKFYKMENAIERMDPSERDILSLRFPGEHACLALNILASCEQDDPNAIAVCVALSQ
jgi:hypothetical protein